jgi:hypothetical protein
MNQMYKNATRIMPFLMDRRNTTETRPLLATILLNWKTVTILLIRITAIALRLPSYVHLLLILIGASLRFARHGKYSDFLRFFR